MPLISRYNLSVRIDEFIFITTNLFVAFCYCYDLIIFYYFAHCLLFVTSDFVGMRGRRGLKACGSPIDPIASYRSISLSTATDIRLGFRSNQIKSRHFRFWSPHLRFKVDVNPIPCNIKLGKLNFNGISVDHFGEEALINLVYSKGINITLNHISTFSTIWVWKCWNVWKPKGSCVTAGHIFGVKSNIGFERSKPALNLTSPFASNITALISSLQNTCH